MKRIIIAVILLLHFVILFVYLTNFISAEPDRDEGLLLYGAQRILSGETPHKDFFYLHTSIDIYILAIIFKFFGTSFWIARFTMLIFMLLTDLCIIVIACKLSKEYILPALISLFFFIMLLSQPIVYSYHNLSTAFLVFTMTFILYARYFFAGITGGFVLLLHEPKGIALLPVYMMFFVLRNFERENIIQGFKKGLKVFLIFLSGMLLMSLGYILFMTYTNSFDSFLSNVKFASSNYSKFNEYPFLYVERIVLIYGFGRNLIDTYYIFFVFVLTFLPLILSITDILIFIKNSYYKKSITEEKQNHSLISFTYIIFFLASLYRPDFARVGLIPVPVTLIILFSTIYRLKKDREFLQGIKSLISIFIIPVIIVWSSCTFIKYLYDVWHLKEKPKCVVTGTKESIIFYSSGCLELNKIVGEINSSKVGAIFVYHWSPILYFILDKKNPTYFNAYKPIFNTNEQMQRIINELEISKPTYIIKDNYIEMFNDPKHPINYLFPMIDHQKLKNDPVDDYIKSHYQIFFDSQHWKLFRLPK
jgi:hypothetical protein